MLSDMFSRGAPDLSPQYSHGMINREVTKAGKSTAVLSQSVRATVDTGALRKVVITLDATGWEEP